MLIVNNAFSLNMLPKPGGTVTALLLELGMYEAAQLIKGAKGNVINNIGHKNTDRFVRDRLLRFGVILPEGERKSMKLKEDDLLLVAQYCGDRLPEGCTHLPENSYIKWWSVEYSSKI